MTSLLNIAGNIPVVAEAGGQSLRFEDGDSAYLTRTPTSAGNRRTWTFSTWIKRGNITSNQGIFGAESSGDRLVLGFGFSGSDQIRFYCQSPSTDIYTSAVLRDPSAWYNIVWAVDTTQATSTNRIKIYVNGEQITSFASASYPAQNSDYSVNNTVGHYIGRWAGYAGEYLDGYLANACFIDGQQLDPTSFGEYDGTLWKPKSDTAIQSLTFGTNGFYLPFKQTTEAEGFSTVTYTGTGSSQAIKGVGFEPDVIWVKARNTSSYGHKLYDSVRGFSQELSVDATDGEYTLSGRVSANSDGFDLGTYAGVNGSGNNYVAWCWDAGSGSAVSNTDGSITSTVKANTAKGFSITSYVGNGTAGATVGHGLSSAPDMVIVKIRSGFSGGTNWRVYHSALGATKNIILNSTGAAVSETNKWNDTAPTSSVFSLGNHVSVNENNATAIAYCFHSVSGYSSIGSYTGTGATGNSVTTGFEPSFVMIKRTDSTGNWHIFDNTREPNGDKALYVNLSNAESGGWYPNYIKFTSTGFEVGSGGGSGGITNVSGGTYIYMAIADTRDATFFGDTSGNGNNWTPNALNNTDVVPDSPVTGGNFATLNPLDAAGISSNFYLHEGNLAYSVTNNSSYRNASSTFFPEGLKGYYEFSVTAGTPNFYVGMYPATSNPSASLYTATNTIQLNSNGTLYNGSTTLISSMLSSFSAGDVGMVAFDFTGSSKYIWFGKNGSWGVDGSSNTQDPAGGNNPAHTFTTEQQLYFASNTGSGTQTIVANFGQDSSFAGNKTPQGNTDDNGVGDFYYAPPSGYLALTTGNLPAATITAPDDYFNTVLYTGTGASNSITVGFQPDWVWAKRRSSAASHGLVDAVRGAGQTLFSNLTDVEDTGDSNLTSFDTDGFTAGTGGNFNTSGQTYVAWNWLAGNGTSSNTDGSITSTVSANQTAGFSIATYSGQNTAGTFGHGLGVAPSMVIIKRRNTSGTNWVTYHSGLATPTTNIIYLNTTGSTLTGVGTWNSTAPSSTVVSLTGNDNQVNQSGGDYVAYCFAEVESYSKIGSYTGNGSTDGTFVHCGFRPAWVMLKNSSTTGSWRMYDVKRPNYNPEADTLYAESSGAEDDTSERIDILSNGFKIRSALTNNASGVTVIFLAFAEAPFKSANAR